MRRSRPCLVLPAAVALAAGCGPSEPGTDRGDLDALASQPLFTLVPSSRTGIRFANRLPENFERNGLSYQYYYNGGGVAVGDVNGDGLPDLYFTANMGPNRLYLNRGDLTFEDVTAQAGVQGSREGWATGVTLADVDADGRLDIYVGQSGPFGDEDLRRNLLYVNRQAEGTDVPVFTEEAAARGLDDPGYATQAAFFDADADGDLDAYLMNVGIPGYRSILQLQEGRSPYETDKLFRNDGGRFVDVSDEAGLIDTNLGFGLGLSVGDVNNDGLPDIYVANDYSGRDYLYLGRPGGRFVDVLTQAVPHTPLSSMGSDLGDLDGDGWLDLVVLEMALPTHYDRVTADDGLERARFDLLVRRGLHYQYLSNALQWNRGVPDGRVPRFSDVTGLAGLGRTDWSWAPLFADLDNDGRPDLFISNGMAGRAIDPEYDEYVRRRDEEVRAEAGHVTEALVMELIGKMPRRRAVNLAFRNDGDLTFTDVTSAWGFQRPTYSNGVVYADLDRDGDLDLVVNNLLEEAHVYRNHSRERDGGHYLAVQLRGPAGNPFGIGARVRLVAGGVRQMQELQLTRGYQSSVEPRLHFGLGASPVVDTLEVTWPDGSREVRTGLAADGTLTLDRADAGASKPAGARAPPLFQALEGGLRPLPRHRAEVSLTDPSLRPYPSKRDPVAFAVGDVDGDGLDDVLWGGSGGEASWIYTQGEDGRFRADVRLPQSGSERRVVAAVLLDADGDGCNDVWLATEYGGGGGPTVVRHRLFLNDGGGRFGEGVEVISETGGEGVTLAPGDFDGDGRVDVFVGHRTTPGTGPAPGSLLLRGEGAAFRDVTAEVAPVLSDFRTVTDAVWADLDGDGAEDLVLVGEWMPPTVLLNEAGRLRERTGEAGLDTLYGWWQSLAVADLDGDGDPDLVAGNLGLDHPYHPTRERPFELYVADFDGDGDEEAVPAYHEAGGSWSWFGRSRLGEVLPWVEDLYRDLDAFGRASLQDIVGADALAAAERFQVRALASLWLENVGGGRFRPRSLPRVAQLSPVSGIVPADFDGDGHLDLALAGNLYAFDPTVPRLDAGVGLYLRGDGTGAWQAVAPMESGLWIQGPARGLRLVRVGPSGAPGVLAGIAGVEPRMYVRSGG